MSRKSWPISQLSAGTMLAIIATGVAGCGAAESDRGPSTPVVDGDLSSGDHGETILGSYDGSRSDYLSSVFFEIDAPSYADNSSSAMSFLVYRELGLQKLREEGLATWSANPEDVGRYSWLVLTVNLSPVYPLDIREWAGAVVAGESSTPLLDEVAIADWHSKYQDLRHEFWESTSVTENQRRLLWFGEIKTALRQCEIQYEVSHKCLTSDIPKRIVEFFERYPKAFSLQDLKPFDLLSADIILTLLALKPLEPDDPANSAILAEIGKISPELSSVVEQVRLAARTERQYDPIGNGGEYWDSLPAFPVAIDSTSFEGRYIYFFKRMSAVRLQREIGAELWANHSTDERRYSWYRHLIANSVGPAFPRNVFLASRSMALDWGHTISIDADARNKWQDGEQDIRREYLAWLTSRSLSEDSEESRNTNIASYMAFIARQDYVDALLRWKHEGDRSKAQTALSQLQSLVDEHFDGYAASRIARGLIGQVLDSPELLGIELDEYSDFLEWVRLSSQAEIRSLSDGRDRRATLARVPIELLASTLDGEPFDLSDLRGKIVLLGFWTTSCASCIAAMPAINEIYLDYRDKGFEVVSVNFDSQKNPKLLSRINGENGLTWTTLAADELWGEINERFGFGNKVPQYMLLDRDGLLVADTKAIDYGENLEALLDELLAAEATQKEAATIE